MVLQEAQDTTRNLALLFLISKFESGLVGRTRLQKLVYLSKIEGHVDLFYYPFHTYLYGPYSSIIFKDLDQLRENGYVIEKKDQIVEPNGQIKYQYTYSLTDKGKEKVVEFQLQSERLGIEKTVSKYRDLSLSELLKYVYATYL